MANQTTVNRSSSIADSAFRNILWREQVDRIDMSLFFYLSGDPAHPAFGDSCKIPQSPKFDQFYETGTSVEYTTRAPYEVSRTYRVEHPIQSEPCEDVRHLTNIFLDFLVYCLEHHRLSDGLPHSPITVARAFLRLPICVQVRSRSFWHGGGLDV